MDSPLFNKSTKLNLQNFSIPSLHFHTQQFSFICKNSHSEKSFGPQGVSVRGEIMFVLVARRRRYVA